MKKLVAFLWRVIGRIGHEIAETIRYGAVPVGVSRSVGGARQGDSIPSAIGGAMIVGAGRRIGSDASEGAQTESETD